MRCVFIYLIFSCLSILEAQSLPKLNEETWEETYHGYEHRGMDIQLTTKGKILIFPKEKRERCSKSHVLEVSVLVEHKESANAKWVKKQIYTSGFKFSDPANLQQESVIVEPVVTGDIRYNLSLTHSKSGVEIKVVNSEKNTEQQGEYKISLILEIPDLYNLSHSEASNIKQKTKRDLVTISLKSTTLKYKLGESFDVTTYADKGFHTATLKAERYDRNVITCSLLDSKKGALHILPKNETSGLHKGFYLSTVIRDETGSIHNNGIQIQIK